MPTGSAVVVQIARFDEIATAEQPVIGVPLTVKSTVPVAPDVTVAVSMTVCPNADVTTETLNETVEALPAITAKRGVERSLKPAPFFDCKVA